MEYVKTLIKELNLWLTVPEISEINWDTIYIGGGTPSILTFKELDMLASELPLKHVQEFTIEANPEDVTEEWVNQILHVGVNRVSIGIQSFIDEELVSVRRNHRAIQALNALEIIRHSGVKNVSADLIYGLPHQNLNTWKKSLDRLLSFHPEHISAYSLSYEPGTRLHAMLKAGKITETPDDIICRMYTTLTERMSDAGYEHYEISNFGIQGKHSRHNSAYWTFSPYLGIGAGAHGYVNGIRCANPRSIPKYIKGISAGKLVSEQEILTRDDIYNEYLLTSLRTSGGTAFSRMMELTDSTYVEKLKKSVLKPLKYGMLEETMEGLRIPESKWLISDAIIRDLMI